MKDSEGLRGELQGRVAVALTCRAVALGKSSPLNLDVLICRRNNDAVAEVVSGVKISPPPTHTALTWKVQLYCLSSFWIAANSESPGGSF